MMRIVLFADTHGNLPATQIALAAIAQARPDQIVCLGDVAMFGPQPREVLGVVAALGCPVVMGNTDYHSPSNVQITLHRVPLDVQPILDAAFASGMPMADRWIADWSNA